uniref:Ribosomal protein S11 n=1 Tax=Dictyopteris divaricata TaxID=156996 RepID=A0A4Y5T8E1_9PHAE|nr:ribosomal protein S11 [Dictyopteris divaricata]QDB64130.1 ribosomal protein S11 [Dictyopteris divaricata]
MSNKHGIVYIRGTKRNTFCVLIDGSDQKVKISSSVGSISPDKASPYVTTKLLAQYFVQRLIDLKYVRVSVVLRGLGVGRGVVINSLRNSGLHLHTIKDTTLSPHNGCRPPKVRRKKFRTRVSFKIKKFLSLRF